MEPEGTRVRRLVVDPFPEKLYSSKAEEFAAIEVLMDKGVSYFDTVSGSSRREQN